MQECESVFIPKDQPEPQFLGWGKKFIPTVLWPLQYSPEVSLSDDTDMKLVDLWVTFNVNDFDWRQSPSCFQS